MKRFLASVFALLALHLHGDKKPFENYQSIVDRQMFGKAPPNFDATRNPSEKAPSLGPGERELTKEEEEARSAIRFSAINVTPSGEIAVGFVDVSDAKSPVHYYLKVGEESGGWAVKSADAVEKTMTLSNPGGLEIKLKLGENPAPAGGKNARRDAGKRPDSLRGRNAERRAEREAEMERVRKSAEDARKSADEERKRLEEERKRMEEEREQDRAEIERNKEEQKKELLSLRDELSKMREESKNNEEEEGGEEE